MVPEHDVIAVSSVVLDAKTCGPPKKANDGIYGTDWWNICVPIPLIEKLTSDIKEVSGHIVNQECVVMDNPQSLALVTINVRDHKDSPPITMITTPNKK